MDKNHQRMKFDSVLLESIDEALNSLGENVKISIYFHLETKFLIARQDIPDRIDDFSNALERIFGLGARHLELLIMKKLHEKIGCQYKWEGPKWLVPDLTFGKYVKLMKLYYEGIGKGGEVEVIVVGREKPEQRI